MEGNPPDTVVPRRRTAPSWLGQPGDRWSLARVYAALLIGAVVGGLLGYVVDLVIEPLIGQSGWWTVTGCGGAIAGLTAQAVREFATPRDPEPSTPTRS
jgi:hypothetical protein